MIIGVAGPVSADSREKRQENIDRLNKAAARLLGMGHIPLVGVNAALPVLEHATEAAHYEAVMDISLAVIGACEGLLMLDESPGANRERDLVASKGLPVYYDFNEIPEP